jgi:hypothetical protein
MVQQHASQEFPRGTKAKKKTDRETSRNERIGDKRDTDR